MTNHACPCIPVEDLCASCAIAPAGPHCNMLAFIDANLPTVLDVAPGARLDENVPEATALDYSDLPNKGLTHRP